MKGRLRALKADYTSYSRFIPIGGGGGGVHSLHYLCRKQLKFNLMTYSSY